MPQTPALFLLLLLALGLFGCTSNPSLPSQPPIQVVGGKGLAALSQAGQPLSFAGLVGQLLDEDVIYIGERHDHLADHQIQLALLEALHHHKVKLAIGLEWIQRPFQQHLDDFIAGRIDEAEMLRRTQYFSRWGVDYRHYRPIIQLARAQGIPLLGLNAPSELVQAIMQGGLKSLVDFYVAQLPEEYYFTNEEYEQRLQQVYKQHQGLKSPFSHFYEVQLTWDETMAEQVTRFLESDSETTLVVLAGAGHLEYGHGIPDRVERRTELPGKILLPFIADRNEPRIADFLLTTAPVELPPAGLLGVSLRHVPQPLVVVDLDPAGAAYKAGMRKGDRIVRIDAQAIRDLTDLKLALLDKPPGTEIQLDLVREGEGEQHRSLRLRLSAPGKDLRGQL
ncbi:MAG: ChaN family lipoprotein [Gammaproteobacteria bacterium]|nr:ChaN family lipoprotein [Gammaproteobacteria bacterium]